MRGGTGSGANIVTVTETGERRGGGERGGSGDCRWCGRPLPAPAGPGRPRRFDRQSCRQRDYEARALARRHGLGADELVIDRSQLQDLHDRVYSIEAALEDVEQDLAAGTNPARL